MDTLGRTTDTLPAKIGPAITRPDLFRFSRIAPFAAAMLLIASTVHAGSKLRVGHGTVPAYTCLKANVDETGKAWNPVIIRESGNASSDRNARKFVRMLVYRDAPPVKREVHLLVKFFANGQLAFNTYAIDQPLPNICSQPPGVNPPTVFVQVAGGDDATVQALATMLREAQFDVPRESRDAGADGRREVRYFNEVDKGSAERLARETEAFLIGVGLPERIDVRQSTASKPVLPGHLELWLELPARNAAAAEPVAS